VGIVDTAEALSRAREAGVDLVEVSPTAQPPVCRLMDYGKWLYEQKRRERIAQKKQHTVVLKEIRLRPKIDPHDQTIKLNHARKFLEKGHRVQFTMLFRGREMAHLDHGYALMEEISNLLQDIAKIEKRAIIRGRRMIMILVPK
jgi:translation initiation factor IF-3